MVLQCVVLQCVCECECVRQSISALRTRKSLRKSIEMADQYRDGRSVCERIINRNDRMLPAEKFVE